MKALLSRLARSLFKPAGFKAFFANGYLEGTSITGNKSYLPDASISQRFLIVIMGSSQTNCTASASPYDIPLGICTDAPEATNLDQPVNVALFGGTVGTQRVVLGGTVARGDFLQSNGDGTAIKRDPVTYNAGPVYNIGRALMAGVSGDTIEFVPTYPVNA